MKQVMAQLIQACHSCALLTIPGDKFGWKKATNRVHKSYIYILDRNYDMTDFLNKVSSIAGTLRHNQFTLFSVFT